ncbi:MAG: phosphate ABC transporter permease PtsA [Planctomycetota bacterium]|nr:MAG: phosphate ABC transporter permease PtsA [Planctomycetota bacterium]
MPESGSRRNLERELRQRKRRYRRDRRFKVYTLAALLVAAGFLGIFLVDLIRRGASALRQTEILTTISYRPDSVADPSTAFPEDVRDLVSHSSVRDVSKEGRRAEISVTVHYDEDFASDPASAIRDMTLTKADFPIFLQDLAPLHVSREHLLAMIEEESLESLRQDAEKDPSLLGTTKQAWLRGSAGLQQFLLDSTGLDSDTRESAERLDQAGRLRLEFDHAAFGDGKTVERWVLAESDIDQYVKGKHSEVGHRAETYEQLMRAIELPAVADPDVAAVIAACHELREKQVSRQDAQPIIVPNEEQLQLDAQAWETRGRIDRLLKADQIRLVFNHYFFFNGDSKLPEAAGMKSAVVGSVYVLTLVFIICVPIGVLTSIYLEEFAPDNWLTQVIEVNINNLAAIPSILFGVLGLAALINFFGLPRASVLVGGATLALMTLPIIIISSRAALRAVPDSIRMAGFSMGATRWQVVLHHVLPASISGILTGSILGIAQAMGETAPLIIVGLVAFVPDIPMSPSDAATVMPAQIFSWWEMPQRAFEERAALAIVLLLVVVCALNSLALFTRSRSEKRW